MVTVRLLIGVYRNCSVYGGTKFFIAISEELHKGNHCIGKLIHNYKKAFFVPR